MTSLAPIRPPSSASNRSPTPASQNNNSNVFRHQHSLSSSTPANQHFGGMSPHYGGARSAGGPRQSLDASKSAVAKGPISPRLPTGNSMRPSSEMFGVGGQQIFGGPSLEAEAIDKWFEDLQSYEATLEEMAAASLDVNFKEELSAIEQWFRVLSEAERTAALYSLLQSSTQVQIRFFITVLQQMARSDPMTALLSPAPTGGAASMEQQMEAKLAQLSMKSPASPVVRQFARQSLGTNMNTIPNEPYLSPNSALLNESNHSSTGNSSNDAATLLANQRAKLKANSANRVSAPGHLLGEHSLKSPKWSNFSGTLEEEGHSRSTSPRPKSTGSELNSTAQNASHAAFTRVAASSGTGLESQLSPILGGSWASQVNTPLVPMFSNKDDSSHNQSEGSSQAPADAAARRLAQWGAAHQAGSSNLSASQPTPSLAPVNQLPSDAQPSGIQLDDARKFRRQSKGVINGSPASGFSGVLSGMSSSTNSQSSLSNQTQANGQSPPSNTSNSAIPTLGQLGPKRITANAGAPNVGRTGLSSSINAGSLSSPLSSQSLLNSQQAAMAAQQNWRNGLNSPGMAMNAPDSNMVAMMNTLAGMNGGMNVNGIANLAAMANMSDPTGLQNMANLLNMRQQMQQVQNLQALQQQMQQNGMMGSMMGGAPLLSPVSARLGMNFGFPMMPGAGINGMHNKRSPGGRSPSGKPAHRPGSGSNPDEELDMKLLSDIPSWLHGLRLHKYTPNFEGCTWQEMVLMSDSDLESRGVAAVGARRKMLRTFETVRIKKGMSLPGDGVDKQSTISNSTSDGSKSQETSNTTPKPESDKDANKT